MNKNGLVRNHRPKIIGLIRLFDVGIIILTLACVLSFFQLEFDDKQLWWVLCAVMSFEFFAELSTLYNAPRGVNLYVESTRTLGAWLGAILVITIFSQYKSDIIEPVYKTVFWSWSFFVPIFLILWHLMLRNIINYSRSLGRNTRQVAILGATDIGYELKKTFDKNTWLGFSFIGYFDDRQEEQRLQGKVIINGDIKDLIKKVNSHEVDIIYITLPLKAEKRIKEILAILADTTAVVYFVPDLFGFDLLRSRMENIDGIPVISVHDTPFYGIDGILKRLFDIVIASLILVLISVPLIIIAIGIKLTSPGSILFKQRRYGCRGEEIMVWKFRSMTASDNGDYVKQATKNDMRITPFGDFLRKTSLDELPQFINVLQGRMSIIGPRPHAVAHNELYRGQIKGYMLRHKVKPGITGLAQISGFRGETDTLDKMEGRIYYDLKYIRTWSVLLDIQIFCLTIFKGFRNNQA